MIENFHPYFIRVRLSFPSPRPNWSQRLPTCPLPLPPPPLIVSPLPHLHHLIPTCLLPLSAFPPPFPLVPSLLSAPLYTKIEKDDILDQPNRREVYSYIVNRPGSNLSRLHAKLPIGYGTLVHHLKVLEREKHVRSKKEMGRKLFFPTGTDWLAVKQEREKSRDVSGTPPSDVEGGGLEQGGQINGAGGRPDPLENLSSVPVGLVIMKFLKTNGPATQGEIVKALNLKQTTVSYNIRKLEEKGKVKGSGEKREALYSLKG